MASFSLQIISPAGNLWEGDAEAVYASGIEGEFGVLASHAPMISALQPGRLAVQNEGSTKYYAASEGTLEVRLDGRVVMLVDYAEPCDSDADARVKAEELLDLL